MQHLGKTPVINKIITIKNDNITIRYNNKELFYNFIDVHDIKLTKMKVRKNVVVLNFFAVVLSLFPILFYNKFDNITTIALYVVLLLSFLHFKSQRYEQAYYLKIIMENGSRYRIKIHSKDRLDVIREITSYIDYRFKKSMQELFMDIQPKVSFLKNKVS